MKTAPDHVIDGDLAALGDASRKSIGALDASLNTTGVYRDDRPGIEAKRDVLADMRRRELALMPLTLSHLYAHRVARATAGATALVCAVGLLIVLDDAFLVQLTAWFIPGFAVGMYAVVSTAAVLASYVVATWVAEYIFARRMRELVTKGKDAYRDLDELAVGPFAVAAEKVRRIDRLAITLPLAGIALLVPLLGFVGYVGAIAIAAPLRVESYHSLDLFLEMTRDMSPVWFALLGGAGLAFLVGRAVELDRRKLVSPDSLRLLGHWSMLVVAALVGVIVLVRAESVAYEMYVRGVAPSHQTRLILAIGGEIALLLPATWALLWWRRRERARLGD